MPLKYMELRCAMLRRGLGRHDVAKAIGRSDAYVTTRMHGHKPWSVDEMYGICRLLNIPQDQIAFYFPPGGVAKPEATSMPTPRSRKDAALKQAALPLVREVFQ